MDRTFLKGQRYILIIFILASIVMANRTRHTAMCDSRINRPDTDDLTVKYTPFMLRVLGQRFIGPRFQHRMSFQNHDTPADWSRQIHVLQHGVHKIETIVNVFDTDRDYRPIKRYSVIDRIDQLYRRRKHANAVSRKTNAKINSGQVSSGQTKTNNDRGEVLSSSQTVAKTNRIVAPSSGHTVNNPGSGKRSLSSQTVANTSSGVVAIKPQFKYPPVRKPRNIKIMLMNSRSVRNKALKIRDTITGADADMVFIDETWLYPEGDEVIENELTPSSYKLASNPRTGAIGGGIAILHKEKINKTKRTDKNDYNSFECSIFTALDTTFVCLYHPPPSEANMSTNREFVDEFENLLESVMDNSDNLIILGDFNLHFDDDKETYSRAFKKLLSNHNLIQLVSTPTHNKGHVLDWVIIRRSKQDLISELSINDKCISDHSVITFRLNKPCPPETKRYVTNRNLKRIDLDNLRSEIEGKLSKFSGKSSEAADFLNDVLHRALDHQAPLKTRAIHQRTNAPWINDDIKAAKRRRRAAERRWRKTKSEVDRRQFMRQRDELISMIISAKRDYFSSEIDNCSTSKKLFKIVNEMCGKSNFSVLPGDIPKDDLPDAFVDYFVDKVSKIRENLDLLSDACLDSTPAEIVSHGQDTCPALTAPEPVSADETREIDLMNNLKSLSDTCHDNIQTEVVSEEQDTCHALNAFEPVSADKIREIILMKNLNSFPDSCLDNLACPVLTAFEPISADEIREIILASNPTSCLLDPIPTKLLRSILDSSVSFITNIINDSLTTGTVPPCFKTAHIIPLLKKQNLPPNNLKNYRPVSNLPFLSKVLEKVVLKQLLKHLVSNKLIDPLQSAYRQCHSTETALLRITNDILMSCDQGKMSAITLLDLSAAFDTIDHSILIDRLSSDFGVRGTVLLWIKSYLSNRCQAVVIDGVSSAFRPLNCGVPQGSVLGPVLYTLYTTPLGKIIRSHTTKYHMYADDTQLYTDFLPHNIASVSSSIEETCTTIGRWMLQNRLKLNEEKTESMLCGTSHKIRNSLPLSLNIGNEVISSSEKVKNLGVWLDSCLTMGDHIDATVRTINLELRRITHLKRYIPAKSLITVVSLLVLSRLDYCNSLLAGLQDVYINKLQRVQNRAARIVLNVPRHDHTENKTLLRQLHWLPVRARIEYKIAVLCFNALTGRSPSYIQELIRPYIPGKPLRSSEENLLSVPRTKLKTFGDRAFAKIGPSVWNSLPSTVRSVDSIGYFKKHLKTYLFHKHLM